MPCIMSQTGIFSERVLLDMDYLWRTFEYKMKKFLIPDKGAFKVNLHCHEN